MVENTVLNFKTEWPIEDQSWISKEHFSISIIACLFLETQGRFWRLSTSVQQSRTWQLLEQLAPPEICVAVCSTNTLADFRFPKTIKSYTFVNMEGCIWYYFEWAMPTRWRPFKCLRFDVDQTNFSSGLHIQSYSKGIVSDLEVS